jgi:hypothetical protein
MSDPLSKEHEDGIRLNRQIQGDNGMMPVYMVDELLAELDRMRQELQGVRTQLSVHERHGRVAWAGMFSDSERWLLRFALVQGHAAGSQSGMTDEDLASLEKLMEWFG